MDALPTLLAPVRLTARLLRGTVRLAMAPARVAIASAEVVAEDLLEALRSSGMRPDAPHPFPSSSDRDGPEAVTPSIARNPASKRRRTQIRESRPPVALPDLLEPSEEPWRGGEDRAPGTGAPGGGERAPSPAVAVQEAGVVDAPAPAEPSLGGHVDTEEVLVAEVADPGAAEGAGAELHVEEPWPAYGAMRAAEVLDRLPAQDSATLSVLLLHERAHRARKTVIAAAERELARRA